MRDSGFFVSGLNQHQRKPLAPRVKQALNAGLMKPLLTIVFTVSLLLQAFLSVTVGNETPVDQAGKPIPPGYVLYVTQPNGWGDTREAAIRDLRKRILPWYKNTFGDRPGFYVDWDWYALVEVADGREWQADGRVGWYVPKVVSPAERPKRSKHSHLRSK